MILNPTVYWVRNERFITCIISAEGRAATAGDAILPTCSYCNKIRDEHGKWSNIADYLYSNMDIRFSHGICPTCLENLYSNLEGGV